MNRTLTRTTLAVAAAGTIGLASITAAQATSHAPSATPTHHAAAAAKAGKRVVVDIVGSSAGSPHEDQVAVFHGAINGGGNDSSRGQYDHITLPGGTLSIKHPDSQSTFTPHVNPATCYATFTITGKFTLVRGTGAYQGISGSGHYHAKGTGYLKKKGNGCDMHGRPNVEIFVIHATGTVR